MASQTWPHNWWRPAAVPIPYSVTRKPAAWDPLQDPPRPSRYPKVLSSSHVISMDARSLYPNGGACEEMPHMHASEPSNQRAYDTLTTSYLSMGESCYWPVRIPRTALPTPCGLLLTIPRGHQATLNHFYICNLCNEVGLFQTWYPTYHSEWQWSSIRHGRDHGIRIILWIQTHHKQPPLSTEQWSSWTHSQNCEGLTPRFPRHIPVTLELPCYSYAYWFGLSLGELTANGQTTQDRCTRNQTQIGLISKSLQRKTRRWKSDRRKRMTGGTEYVLFWHCQMILRPV